MANFYQQVLKLTRFLHAGFLVKVHWVFWFVYRYSTQIIRNKSLKDFDSRQNLSSVFCILSLYIIYDWISNGNRTEWSPIRSVLIRVIGRPPSESSICLITSTITDRIKRHEVLLPINHNFNKICQI